jgi:hypothetical protein
MSIENRYFRSPLAYGLTVTVVVLVTEPYEAVIVTFVDFVTAECLTAKVAVECPL